MTSTRPDTFAAAHGRGPGEPLVVCADAGPGIGVGHVMRCLALAAAWRGLGGKVLFVGVFPEALERRICDSGFAARRLPEGSAPQDVVAAALDSLGRSVPGWVALDGYGFTTAHQRLVRGAGARLLAVDDCMHAGRFEADAILNQNPQALGLEYDVQPGCRILAGPRFALLRPEFRVARPGEPRPPKAARRVLLTMGGADPDNVAGTVLAALDTVPGPLDVTVVAGPACIHGQTLARAVEASRHRCEVRSCVQDMAGLMAQADFALTAAGSTCWELCCLGTPFATVIIADNQEPGALALERGGVAPCLGWASDLEPAAMAARLEVLLADGRALAALSRRGMDLVDGQGAGRVAEALGRDLPELRQAGPGDCRMIWEWANDPVVRAASFTSGPIPLEEHERWYAARLADPEHAFFVALDPQGQPVGQVRFAIQGADADISVSLVPAARGLGLGTEVILAGSAAVAGQRGVERVHAYVRKENTASVRAFEDAGFRMAPGHGGHPEGLHFVCGRPLGGGEALQ